MKRVAGALLGFALAAAFAQDAGDEKVLAVLAQVRSQGCVGHAGTPVPLHWSKPLARMASRMHDGEPALTAAEHEDYRASRIFHATVTGARSPEQAGRAFADHYCTEVTEPGLKDFALHRRGASWEFVLANPVELTALSDRRAVAQRVLALVNEARGHARRCGSDSFDAAPPVHANPRLDAAAERHAQDMAAHEYLDHRGRDGSTAPQRVTRAGYLWRDVGENIAAGPRSPQDVVAAWVASPGHCANLMNPVFAEMGIAYAINMKAEAIVYWAQEFGRRQ